MFDIYTYGGGEYLVQLFTALKLFFNSDDWTGMARLAGLLGIVWITLLTLSRKPYFDVKYFMLFAFIYLGLFVPRVDIAVVDRINPVTTGPVVVTNVPFAMGLMGNVLSSIGDNLTRTYETYVTLPNDLRYQNNGMLFGSALIQSGANLQFPDATFANDMNAWIGNCGLWLMTRGIISEDELAKSPDIWELLRNRSSALRFVQLNQINPSTSTNLWSCRDAAENLNGRWVVQIDRASTWWGRIVYPRKPPTEAKAAILATTSGAYNYLANVSRSSSDIIKQQIMIGATKQALMNYASTSDATAAAVNIAQTQADAAQRTTYRVMGQTAGKWLPIFRQVLEAVAWGLFPVAAFAMLLPIAGTVFMTYARMLLWLQLWPPVYAIVNSVMTWYGQKVNVGASLLNDASGNALTLETAGSMMSVNADLMALAGYMAISVPMIAWALVSAISFSGTAIASALGGPASSAAGQAGASASRGDASMGSLSIDNARLNTHSANQMDTTLSARSGGTAMQLNNGAIMTSHPGRQGALLDMPQHRSAVGVNFAAMRSNMFSQAADRAESAASSTAVSSATAEGATLGKALDLTRSRAKGQQHSSGTTISENSALGREMATMSKLVDNWKDGRTWTSAQKAQIMAYASAGFDSGDAAIGKLASAMGFKVGAGGKLQGVSEADLKRSLESARQYVRESGYTEKVARVRQAAAETADRSTDAGERRAASSVRAGLDESAQLRTESSAQRATSASYREAAQSTQQNSASVNTSADENAYQVMERSLGITRAQYAQIEANDPLAAAQIKQQAANIMIKNEAQALMATGDAKPVDPSQAREDVNHLYGSSAGNVTSQSRNDINDLRNQGTRATSGSRGWIDPNSAPDNTTSTAVKKQNSTASNRIEQEGSTQVDRPGLAVQRAAVEKNYNERGDNPLALAADAGGRFATGMLKAVSPETGEQVESWLGQRGIGAPSQPAQNSDAHLGTRKK